MPRYLLDTNACSCVIKRSHEKLLKKLARMAIEDVAISVVTQAELFYGVEISSRRQNDEAAVRGFLRHVEVLDFTSEAALHYAQIRAHLKRLGTMIGANDLFIAAHARALGLTLVSNNAREFKRVPDLKLENWA